MDFLHFLEKRNYFDRFRAIDKLPSVHATTVVSMKYKEGAVLAADSQATLMPGLDKFREPVKKIFVIDSHSVLGIAGSPGLAIEMVKVFKTNVSVEQRITRALSCDSKANLLKRIVMQSFPFVLQTNGQFASEFIFASFDEKRGESRIFSCDPSGFSWEHKEIKYAAIGAGGSHSLAMLDSVWREGLTEKEALDMAFNSLNSAKLRNASTGPPYFFSVADRNGVREISQAELNGGG